MSPTALVPTGKIVSDCVIATGQARAIRFDERAATSRSCSSGASIFRRSVAMSLRIPERPNDKFNGARLKPLHHHNPHWRASVATDVRCFLTVIITLATRSHRYLPCPRLPRAERRPKRWLRFSTARADREPLSSPPPRNGKGAFLQSPRVPTASLTNTTSAHLLCDHENLTISSPGVAV